MSDKGFCRKTPAPPGYVKDENFVGMRVALYLVD